MELTWGIHMGKNSWKTHEMFHGFSNLHGKLIPWNHHGKFVWAKTPVKLMNFDSEFSMKLENKTNNTRTFSYFMERHLKTKKGPK